MEPILVNLEIIDQPELLVVGKSVRFRPAQLEEGRNPIHELWGRCFGDGTFAMLEAMTDHVYKPARVGHAYVGLNAARDPATGEVEHTAGMLMNPGTPVPDGFVARPLAPAKVAVGWVKGKPGAEGAIYAAMHRLVADALAEKGFGPDAAAGWTMELYNCPRWTTPDVGGCIVVDYCIPCKPSQQASGPRDGETSNSNAPSVNTRNIDKIRPSHDTLEIFHLPASRVIGEEASYKLNNPVRHAAAPQWERLHASGKWETMAALPRVIPDTHTGWTCDYVPATDMFSYLASRLAPADTPVPEGCQFRDIPETLVAVGRWGEPMPRVLEQMKALGYIPRWAEAGCGWNAELYFDGDESRPASEDGQGWRWMIPCKAETPDSTSTN